MLGGGWQAERRKGNGNRRGAGRESKSVRKVEVK
jgi:hypothetical protein